MSALIAVALFYFDGVGAGQIGNVSYVLIPPWVPIEPLGTGDKYSRAVIYFLLLCYLFLGVSIIADRFMAAIEVITSKEKKVGEKFTWDFGIHFNCCV